MELLSESNSSRKGLVKTGEVARLYINQRKTQAINKQNPIIMVAALLLRSDDILEPWRLETN